jgi:ferredoxin--NADP+ reductase
MFTLEKRGPNKILEEHQTSLEELNIDPCTLFYRRDAADMPLYPRKKDTPEGIAQARKVSQRLLENYAEKYLFKFEPRCVPKEVLEKDGKFNGIRFQRLDIQEGKLVEIAGDEFDFITEMLISSIGSLPKATPSLPIVHNYLKTTGAQGFQVEGFNNVFAVGNVVTGRGNILESRKHGREITDIIIEEHLGTTDPMEAKYEKIFRNIESDVIQKMDDINTSLAEAKLPDNSKVDVILNTTKKLQQRVGYAGDYAAWVEQNRPLRLENIVE